MINLKVKHLKTLQEKLYGLVGLKNFNPVFFETRFGIHTFGMKVPIDVLILNSNNHIVAFKKDLKPGKVFFWNPNYNRVLELPVKIINPKIGVKLKLTFN